MYVLYQQCMFVFMSVPVLSILRHSICSHPMSHRARKAQPWKVVPFGLGNVDESSLCQYLCIYHVSLPFWYSLWSASRYVFLCISYTFRQFAKLSVLCTLWREFLPLCKHQKLVIEVAYFWSHHYHFVKLTRTLESVWRFQLVQIGSGLFQVN